MKELEKEFKEMCTSPDAKNVGLACELNRSMNFTDDFTKYCIRASFGLSFSRQKATRAALRELGLFKRHSTYVDWYVENKLLREEIANIQIIQVNRGVKVNLLPKWLREEILETPIITRCYNDIRVNNVTRSKLYIYFPTRYFIFPVIEKAIKNTICGWLEKKFGYKLVDDVNFNRNSVDYRFYEFIAHFKYLED